MISQKTIDTVKATAPVLKEHGVTLTTHFYKRMFERNPEVAPYFNPANQAAGKQQRALAGAIAAYAENIDNLGALGPAVELIAQKHAALMIKPEHYPIVGENLLASIREVLGEAATEEIMEAWAEAYAFLADILIAREAEIYGENAARTGGWQGFRTFRVESKVPEGEAVTSFVLAPKDGGALPLYEAGQYVTVRLPFEGTGTQMRNYSLSDAPNGKTLRISVKREAAVLAGAPAGYVSNTLHDEVEVGDDLELGPPCGEFTLGEDAAVDRPLVFLAGGIGVTPLLAMAKAALARDPLRRVVFLHACRNAAVQPLRGEIEALAASHDNASVLFCYSEPRSESPRLAEARYGLLDEALLEELAPEGDPSFYFCGPDAFMGRALSLLHRRGVPSERIHYEFFGPLQALQAA